MLLCSHNVLDCMTFCIYGFHSHVITTDPIVKPPCGYLDGDTATPEPEPASVTPVSGVSGGHSAGGRDNTGIDGQIRGLL